MSKANLLRNSFFLYALLFIVGVIFRIMHLPYAEVFLSLTFFSAVFFIALAIKEISQSDKIDTSEKVMWLVALLFLGLLGAALYYFSGRKKIIGAVSKEG